MKYVQGKIIQERISGVNSMGRNFQRERYCPEGNFLGVIVRGLLSSRKLFRGTCTGGKSPGVNCLGGEFHSG